MRVYLLYFFEICFEGSFNNLKIELGLSIGTPTFPVG